MLEAEVPVWMITNDCFLNAKRFIIVVTGISRLVADLFVLTLSLAGFADAPLDGGACREPNNGASESPSR